MMDYQLLSAMFVLIAFPIYLFLRHGRDSDGKPRSPVKIISVICMILVIGIIVEFFRCTLGIPPMHRYGYDVCQWL